MGYRSWNTTRFDDGSDIWITETRNNYVLHLFADNVADWIPCDISRWDLPKIRKSVSEDTFYGLRIAYVNEPYEVRYTLCSFCAARPTLIEHDCDGPYRSSSCGDERCNSGDIRHGRRNQSASVRAQFGLPSSRKKGNRHSTISF